MIQKFRKIILTFLIFIDKVEIGEVVGQYSDLFRTPIPIDSKHPGGVIQVIDLSAQILYPVHLQ
jgi:hypothetical protein